jgi:cytochrome c5
MQGPTPHHVSPIKNWQQLVVVVVLAFVVPIAVIALLAQYVTDVSVPADVDAASRIKPVGEVVVESAGGAGAVAPTPAPTTAQAPAASASPPKAAVQTASTPAAAATTAAAPAAARPDGKKVFDTTCTACHTPGVAGAPKFGDKAAWAPRLKQGMDALYAAALKGKGAMPAKGGNASLPDADVKAAVDYMAAAVK